MGFAQKTVVALLEKSGFSLCGVCSDFDFTAGDENSCERLYIIAKKEEKDEK